MATKKKAAAKRETAKTGSGKRGAAKTGTAKRGAAKRGAAKRGAAKRGAAKRGASKTGAAKTGTAKRGAAKTGASIHPLSAASTPSTSGGASETEPTEKRPHLRDKHAPVDDMTSSGDELLDIFMRYDRDRTGSIDRRELARLLEALGQNISDEELEIALEAVDLDHSGKISYKEFRSWWLSL